jgi:dynein heavy chain
MKVPAFVYDKEIPYFELLVPTSDTYKHSYLMEMLMGIEKNVFFTGITGVGKSSIVGSCLAKL